MNAEVCSFIPASWAVRSLESVSARITSGGTPSRRDPAFYEHGHWPWVKTKELSDGWIADAEERITDEAIARSSAKILPRTTILLAMYGATVGQLGILRREMTCNQACCAFLVDESQAHFLYVYYQLLFSRPQLKSMAVGAAQQNLSGRVLRDFCLPFPSLSEQQAIAHVLGTLDDKIELNRRMNQTLEEMARALFKSWFEPFETSEDQVTTAQDLIDEGSLIVNDGYRAKRVELAATGLPFARAGNINNGFLLAGAEILGEEGVRRAGFKVSAPMDVVFTSKGTVGRFAFVTPTTPKFVYSPQLCFWRSLDYSRLSPFFLLYWMRSPSFLRQVATVSGQTDMAPYVSLRDQRRMSIIVPPAEEQERLAGSIKSLVEKVGINDQEITTLERLRDTLLPKLLSGDLRIDDPEKFLKENVP